MPEKNYPIIDIPYFDKLKKTLKGKNNQFFLVNDSNQEIRQHYDHKYNIKLDINRFRESIKSKQEYFKNKNIKYHFYVVPDKSITLQKYLPFKTNPPYRHTDRLNDLLTDLHDIIKEEDTIFNDTHINFKASYKVIPHILSKIHEKSFEEYRKELEKRTLLFEEEHEGDLFGYKNWSYPRDNIYEENRKIKLEKIKVRNDYTRINTNEIPPEYRYVSIRESEYYINENSILDKKAVILHDSTIAKLKEALIATYREVFFYWDHWYFNKDLIDWFKPDEVLEIRTERFMENPVYSIINEDYCPQYPTSAKIKDFDVNTDRVKFNVELTDFRKLHQNMNIKIMIDDNLITQKESESPFNAKILLQDYEYGEHLLQVEVQDIYGKIHCIKKSFPYYEPLDKHFKNLKRSLKGRENIFFRVHDRHNEILQHYDKTFIPRLNPKKFKASMKIKEEFLNTKVKYGLFAVPDKSIVLQEYLPFPTDTPSRLIDDMKCVYDLRDLVTPEDYLFNDTNICEDSTVKLAAYMLNILYPNKSAEKYHEELLEKIKFVETRQKGNLFTDKTWSYEKDQTFKKYAYSTVKKIELKNDIIEVENKNIPLEFRQMNNHKSKYYINNDSLLDKKALIVHDNSINPFIKTLIACFNETFFYFDLWYFNKDLLDWNDFDVVLEIREESSFENPVYQLVSEVDTLVLPINAQLDTCINDNDLSIKLSCNDLRNMPVNTGCNILIDDDIVLTDDIVNGVLSAKIDISMLKSGEHMLILDIHAGKTTKQMTLKKRMGV